MNYARKRALRGDSERTQKGIKMNEIQELIQQKTSVRNCKKMQLETL